MFLVQIVKKDEYYLKILSIRVSPRIRVLDTGVCRDAGIRWVTEVSLLSRLL